jgi:hypothetical protein
MLLSVYLLPAHVLSFHPPAVGQNPTKSSGNHKREVLFGPIVGTGCPRSQ